MVEMIDPIVLRCAVVIFREDGLAREGRCVCCPRVHQEASATDKDM